MLSSLPVLHSLDLSLNVTSSENHSPTPLYSLTFRFLHDTCRSLLLRCLIDFLSPSPERQPSEGGGLFYLLIPGA